MHGPCRLAIAEFVIVCLIVASTRADETWGNCHTLGIAFDSFSVETSGLEVSVSLRQYKGIENDVQADGNLHWCVDPSVEVPVGFLDKVRDSKFSEANKERYPPEWASRSIVADPGFVMFDWDGRAVCDYRLQEDSPAIGTGIVLPDDLEDPLRLKDGARPDIGALPRGGEMFAVGRFEDTNSIMEVDRTK